MLLIKNKSLRRIQGLFETFNLLFFKLLLKNPRKASSFPGEIFRTYMSLVEKDKWLCKDILEAFSGTEQACKIIIEHLPNATKGLPLHELASLAFITKVTDPKQIFEIGTYSGRTALNFAQNSQQDSIVWTLDTSANETQIPTNDMDYKDKDVEHKIRQLRSDSLKFDFSPHFGNIDLVFVNGSHNYETVRSDTINAIKMVRPNGYIIWHDFANYGDCNDVTRAVLDRLPGNELVQIATTQLAFYLKSDRTS